MKNGIEELWGQFANSDCGQYLLKRVPDTNQENAERINAAFMAGVRAAVEADILMLAFLKAMKEWAPRMMPNDFHPIGQGLAVIAEEALELLERKP
jgi:hypothetical protein